MNILKAYAEAQRLKDQFHHLEKTLELPKGSIEYEYEKELVLSGVPITEAKEIHKELMIIGSETPFSTDTVISIHRRVKDVGITRNVIEYASMRAIYPHLIVDVMHRKDNNKGR